MGDMEPVHFAVTYDYRCPFARNAHEHLVVALRDGAPWNVEAVPFSLSQVHVEEGGLPVWEDPAKSPDLIAEEAGLAPDEIAAVISPELAATTFKGGTLPGANLGSFADGELTELVERLRRHEAVLSAERRVLHERIDLLQAIVVERYKSGAAHADSLLEAHNPATEEGDTEADSP